MSVVGTESNSDMIAAFVGAAGTVLAALVVTVAGSFITRRYTRERDRQDKESQWRSHAIEITKLDAERQMKQWERDGGVPLEPFILTFLANYRDLSDLGSMTPRELYLKIRKDRIASPRTGGASNLDRKNVAVCAGEDRISPHPRVFLAIPAGGRVLCPYCNRSFTA